MGSLSVLQQIFPTQELNQSLLQCRQILYELSYEESPKQHLEPDMEQLISSKLEKEYVKAIYIYAMLC